MTQLYIKEDITDWRDEALKSEIIPESPEDIFAAIEAGEHSAKVARAAIVSRAMGKAPDDIIRPNKVLLNVGAQADVISLLHTRKTEVQTEGGKTYEVSAYVGRGMSKENGNGHGDETETDDAGPSYVKSGDPLALQRAEKYILRNVTGNIWNHFLHIHNSDGDVEAIAEQLKTEIDAMVSRITQPSG